MISRHWMKSRLSSVQSWMSQPAIGLASPASRSAERSSLRFGALMWHSSSQGGAYAEALQVEGAHLFDPRGKGHPMKEWVQIPAAQSSTWNRFARQACEYVAGAAQGKKDEIFLGDWSVKDLLAHLVGWDYTNLFTS